MQLLNRLIKPAGRLLILPVVITAFSALQTFSQGIVAVAKTDTTTILIGQQFNLQLQLSHSKNLNIQWVEIPDTLGKLEIIQKSGIDTITVDAANLSRRQTLTFTCFDSGFHVIPPFQFSYRQAGDTTVHVAETRPLLITVNTIPVDTTKAIKEIRGPVEVPWTLADFLPYIGGVILLALAGWGIWYYLKKRKKKTVHAAPAIPTRPAHEIALESLRKLEEEKIWQQGNHKLYHTRLTDILRTYIEHRWQLPALEQTTDEILAGFSKGMMTEELFAKLRIVLETADLVKFAKMQPVAYENEQCMADGYDFVKRTAKTAEIIQEKEAKP